MRVFTLFKHHDFMIKSRCHYSHPYLYLHIETEAIIVRHIHHYFLLHSETPSKTNFFSLELASLLLIYSLEK